MDAHMTTEEFANAKQMTDERLSELIKRLLTLTAFSLSESEITELLTEIRRARWHEDYLVNIGGAAYDEARAEIKRLQELLNN